MRALIKMAVDGVGADERVAVGVCGPVGLIMDTRAGVKECVRGEGSGVTLHAETFGW